MKLQFLSQSFPEDPGYPDVVKVNDREFACSCCPNPFRPSDHETWEHAYGWLAAGSYKGKVVDNQKHGKCVLLGDGGELPARRPNVNHKGRAVVTEVFFHAGDTTWRGSAACLTAPPAAFEEIMQKFNLGDSVDVEIIDELQPSGGVA